MSLDEPDRIESIAKGDEELLFLTISEYRNWSEIPRVREKLKQKIEKYCQYTKSTEYKEEYGEVKPIILLMIPQEPPQDIARLLEKLSQEKKIKIDYKITPVDSTTVERFDSALQDIFQED